MESVFILEHSYEIDSIDEIKFIGVYTSKKLAELTIEKLIQQPGFCDRQNDFEISECKLNQDGWTEGFSTMTSIQVKDINNEWKTVQAECLVDGNYKVIELYENELLHEFKHLDVVKCIKSDGVLYANEKIEK